MLRILMATAALLATAAPVQVQALGAQAVQTPVGQVGGDADVHGCLPSAGYTWSIVQETCIQMWTAGIRLDPVKPDGSAVMSAFVVFASWHDHHRAEVYVPKVKGSLILVKAHGAWRGNGYTLTLHKGTYTLADDQGGPVYAGPPAAR